MVYEWLTGEPPFRGSLYEVFSQHLHEPPPSLCARLPELPSAVEDVVFGALAKDPRQRFVSVQDFATVLEGIVFAIPSLSAHGTGDQVRGDLNLPPVSAVVAIPSLPSGRQDRFVAVTLPLWNVPYRRNPFFIGREEVLKHLYDKLTASGSAALTQTQAIS